MQLVTTKTKLCRERQPVDWYASPVAFGMYEEKGHSGSGIYYRNPKTKSGLPSVWYK